MSDIFADILLDNGIRVEFVNHSNRYYGDYHRIHIEVKLRFSVDDYATAHTFKNLERMGVKGDDVDKVHAELIDNFCTGTIKYMQHEQFVSRFLQQKRGKLLLAGWK